MKTSTETCVTPVIFRLLVRLTDVCLVSLPRSGGETEPVVEEEEALWCEEMEPSHEGGRGILQDAEW